MKSTALMTVAMLMIGLALPVPAQEGGSEAPAVSVRLATVGAHEAVESRRFVGRVEALRTVDLAFQRPGQIVELDAVQGTRVPEGALIAALDAADFELELRRAEAGKQLAEVEFRRARELVERDAAPESRLDQQIADLALAEVALDTAARNLALARLEAPFDALITRRLADNYANVTAANPVVRVQDVSELRVTISVPEDLIWLVRNPEGFIAKARLAALPDAVISLEFREFVAEADDVAQTYEVSLAIVDPLERLILPGMTATVEISAKTGGDEVFEIPLGAVDPNGPDGFQVWVHDPESGTVSPRSVELGLPQTETVAVRSGLERGEKIVSAGVSRLTPGQRVRPYDL